MSAALVYNECYNPNSNRRMEPRLRKDKNSVSNINININLKVESKANYIGKKITNSKEIQQKESDAVRPNITTESLKRKKKMEFANTRCKRSLIEFIEENTISYEQEDLTPNKREEKGISRRDKSRSMQNLKAKSRQENCPGKQMERTSKSKDQSRSRSYRNSNSKSNSYSYKKSHQKSPLRSAERSKSKSKSQ